MFESVAEAMVDPLHQARSLPPGPECIAALAAIERAGLAPEQRLEVIELWERCDYWLQAQKQPHLADLAACPVEGDERWCTWEVAAALRLGEGTAADRLQTASALVTRVPRTLAELEAGRLTYWQARDIAMGTTVLSAADAGAVEDRVLARARVQTRAETRRAVERAVLAIDPAAAEERRRQRRRERRIERPRPTGDGMAGTWVEGPAETLAGFHLVLTALARDMKRTGAVGTVGAGRFDIVMSLVLALGASGDPHPAVPGRQPEAPLPTRVGLIVRQSTLRGDDDEPADIPGYGPVSAAVARRLVAGRADSGEEPLAPGEQSPWDEDDPAGVLRPDPVAVTVLPVDPATGWLVRPGDDGLDRGRDRRLATQRQRRYVVDRDRICFFPGCTRVAEHNDVDHRHEWTAGGRTDANLLGSACPHHNRVTKNNGWTIRPGPDGTATLISPLGRRYPITPYNYWDP